MTKKELTTTGPKELATPDTYDLPWDETTDAMMPTQMPWLTIAMGQAKNLPDGCKHGQFYVRGTDVFFDEFRGLWITTIPTRTMFPPQYDPESKVLCRSLGGLNPTGEGEDPQKGPCGEIKNKRYAPVCPHSIWQNGKPPRCMDEMNMLLMSWGEYELASGIFVVFRARRTALDPYRKLKADAQMKAGAVRMQLKGKPISPLTVMQLRITTEQKENYYIPRFSMSYEPGWMPEEKAVDLTAGMKELRNMLLSSLERQEEQQPAGQNGAEEEEIPF